MTARLALLASALLALAVPASAEPPTPAKGTLPPGAVARIGNTALIHPTRPLAVAFSPDGKQLVTGAEDGVVRVWDVTTGGLVGSARTRDMPVTAVRFTQKDARLAVGFSDGHGRLLDAKTFRDAATFQTLVLSDFTLSADGSLIATFGPERNVLVAEAENGLDKLELPPAFQVAFHPNGKTVAAGDADGKVTLYQLVGGKPIATVEHGGRLNGLIFRADGKALVTAGSEPTPKVKVWELGSAAPVAELDAAGPVGYLDDGRLFAARGTGVGIYDFTKRAWVHEIRDVPGMFAVSPDGTKLAATGAGDLRVRLWDVATGRALHAAADGFPDVSLLVPTADGRAVFGLTGARAFRWGLEDDVTATDGVVPAAPAAAAVGGTRLVVAAANTLGIADRFDPASPASARPTRTVEVPGNIVALAVSSDGKRVACSTASPQIHLIDPAAGKVVRTRAVPSQPMALAFLPDGDRLLVLGRDGWLRLLDLAKEDSDDVWKLRVPVRRTGQAVISVSPDGKRIAAASTGRLSVVDATAGKELFGVDRPGEVGTFRAATFSPDGHLLITAADCSGGAVQVWEIATRTEVRRYSTGLGGVTRLAVFADGSRVVSAGTDEAVTVWDTTFRDGKTAPTEADLKAAWAALEHLAGADGYPAVRTLIVGGGKSVGVISAGIDDLLDTQKRANVLIGRLGAPEYRTREAASQELVKLGPRALPAIRDAAAGTPSPEVKRRAGQAADTIAARNEHIPAHGMSGDTLRLVRVVMVLDAVGGKDAAALLGRIAELGGTPGEAATAALAKVVQP